MERASSFTDENGTTYTLTKSDNDKLRYSSGSGSSKKFYWPAGCYTVVKEPAAVYLSAPAGSHENTKNAVFADSLAEAVEEAKNGNTKTIYVCGNITVDMASAVSLNSGITFARLRDHPSGHMFTIKGAVTPDNARIDGRAVKGGDSMLFVPSGGHLTIAGNTLIENGKNAAPKGSGGAIYIQSGTTAHMKNVYVSGNTGSDPWLAHNNYTAVAVCPSGELAVYELDGLLAVNNGKADIGVIAGASVFGRPHGLPAQLRSWRRLCILCLFRRQPSKARRAPVHQWLLLCEDHCL